MHFILESQLPFFVQKGEWYKRGVFFALNFDMTAC